MYKITAAISVQVIPYMEEDELASDSFCFETLPEAKEKMYEHLEYLKQEVSKLTMRNIKNGVYL